MPPVFHQNRGPSCPNCGAALERAGDLENRYWSCRDCNLIFLP